MTNSSPPHPVPDHEARVAPQAGAPAWSDDELARDPHGHAQKAAKVRSMFAAIAGSYDLNNRVHSLWRDQAWRRYAVRSAKVKPGERVLDVACGTGDLTEAFARSPAGQVIGLDFTAEMLDIARLKRRKNLSGPRAEKVSYQQGDAMALPFDSASFDVLSIAFGIRNVSQPPKALAEFARVLKPDGRLVILEFGQPGWFPMKQFNDFYCGTIMPRTATIISGDRSGAYKYLPKSVGSFYSREQMIRAIESAGFAQVKAKSLTLGICVCYTAQR